jgi:cytochrome c553
MRKIILLLTASLIIVTVACKHEPPESATVIIQPPVVSCDTKEVCFESSILPIFKTSCAKAGCHDAGSREGGYVLDSYVNIVKKGLSTGNAGNSKIYTVLSKSGSEQMPPPPAAPLPQAQKDSIAKWINGGAKNTIQCNCSCDSTKAGYGAIIQPMMQLNCVGCHNSNILNGGINLSNYNAIKAVALNGKLLGSIAHTSGFSPMPQNANKLSDCQIKQVDKWIKNGVLNN